jgi:hypothetical protein
VLEARLHPRVDFILYVGVGVMKLRTEPIRLKDPESKVA